MFLAPAGMNRRHNLEGEPPCIVPRASGDESGSHTEHSRFARAPNTSRDELGVMHLVRCFLAGQASNLAADGSACTPVARMKREQGAANLANALAAPATVSG
ncbi:hypothetical protein PSEUDO8O_30235 [Pseudomonas sp. 8O]|nr:hypothetical protein PSEUDO8O_30235 [Pseudomonas sp. 8O]